MEVELKEQSGTVIFDMIEVGDLFYNNGIYMKIDLLETTNEGLYNAIRLNDGNLDYFYFKQKVNRINGKLIAEFD